MLRTFLYFVVAIHLLVVFVNMVAFFILPFMSYFTDIPFWLSIFFVMPIQSAILFLTTARTPCPLTLLENSIRKQLGMKEIGGFIGYYIIKQRWRKNNKWKVND